MNKLKGGVIVIGLLYVLITMAFLPVTTPAETSDNTTQPVTAALTTQSIYNSLQLSTLGLNPMAYNMAVKGWQKMKRKGQLKNDILAICDFTQSGNNKRLYIIDMATGTLLFNSLVAHGRNTGEEYARNFSNEPSSLKSSLGFYITGNTYYGEHGLGLRLLGQEPGFNDKAEQRAIVMHAADYVSADFIAEYGKLGRSWGCPAVPTELHRQIINTIKDGSCLFIYYPDKKYLSYSKMLH